MRAAKPRSLPLTVTGVSRGRRAAFCLLLIGAVASGCRSEPPPAPGAPREFEGRRMLMGTRFDIKVVAGNEAAAAEAVRDALEEVARVEDLLSEWKDSSQISEVNRRAGQRPVPVGPDLYTVIERSLWASEVTGGAFDITFAGCGRYWSFREARIPDPATLKDCLGRVDYRRVRLDPERSAVFLPDAEMRIGIAGIGKGYGVDRAADLLEAHGIDDYIVEGGGDVRLRGSNVGRPWKVGIAHPRRGSELFATLALDRGSIVTSGDYENFFERDGVRYHHILDPATGMPARRSVAVTVIAATAMDADALATGLFVMGPEAGLELVERLEGVEALFFGPDLAVRRSSGFPELSPVPESPAESELGPRHSPITVDGAAGPR